MKVSAIDALAYGLIDGGCGYATNFPGFESQKLFEKLGGKQISMNEKVAFEMSYGASLSGVRSVVSMKSVGLNVCSDSFFASLISGVNAGMVLVVTDDMEMRGSQTRQDSRHFLEFFGGLWFEPNSIELAYKIGTDAFDLSERFDLPVVIRLTNQFFNKEGEIERKSIETNNKTVDHNQSKFIVHPCFWKEQKKRLEEKRVNINEYLLSYYGKSSKFSNRPGVIVAGSSEIELREAQEERDILEVTAYPVPNETIEDFCKNKTDVLVIEQGDNYLLSNIKKTLAQTEIKFNSILGNLPEIDYRIWSETEKLFKAIKKTKPSYVVSDVTQFTVESTEIIDACLCMGAAIPIAIGLSSNGVKYPLCVVGDVSFIHGGISAMNEALARKSNFGLIVVDNGGAWCTGMQKGIMDIYNIGLPIESKIIDYDAASVDEIYDTLMQMQQENKLFVLYIKIKSK